jgi:hypothetical protein
LLRTNDASDEPIDDTGATGPYVDRTGSHSAGSTPGETRLAPVEEGVTPSTAAGGGRQPMEDSESPASVPGSAISAADETIVVDPTFDRQASAAGSRAKVVSSLDMALAIANQDATVRRIELSYQGRLRAGAVNVSGRDLQLVAAEGYSPIVVFQPDPDGMPVTESFLRLENSRLRVQNVHFEMELPRDSFPPWSLLRLEPGCDVALANATITVRIAGSVSGTPPDITVFSVHPPSSGGPRTESGSSFQLDSTVRPISINLTNCVVRGPVSLVRASESTPLIVEWENGLIASTDRLAHLGGTSRPVPSAAKIRIRLSHVTALLQRGLCLLTSNQRFANLIPLELQCDDTIVVTRPDAALIEQRGTASSERFQRQVAYTGNRNFYEGFDALWRISSVSEPERTWGATAWKSYWRSSENSPRFDAVEWIQAPPWQLPAELHTSYDYRLRESTSNPALHSAADFRNAGFAAGLPTLPPDTDGDFSALVK